MSWLQRGPACNAAAGCRQKRHNGCQQEAPAKASRGIARAGGIGSEPVLPLTNQLRNVVCDLQGTGSAARLRVGPHSWAVTPERARRRHRLQAAPAADKDTKLFGPLCRCSRTFGMAAAFLLSAAGPFFLREAGRTGFRGWHVVALGMRASLPRNTVLAHKPRGCKNKWDHQPPNPGGALTCQTDQTPFLLDGCGCH